MAALPRFDRQGQVALVTGAARGLGRAIALALAEAGADVALGLRDTGADGGVAAEIEALGRRALPLQMDVGQAGQIAPSVDAAAAHFGRLDILVNNAGIAPGNPAEDVREEDLDATLAGTRWCALRMPLSGSAKMRSHPAVAASDSRPNHQRNDPAHSQYAIAACDGSGFTVIR
jgi:nucleoside-diphosphate-sugar epimerase